MQFWLRNQENRTPRKNSRHSEDKTVSILREARGGMKVRDVCARHNISEQTCYGWRRKYGGMQVDELRQARALAEEPSAATAKRAAQAHRGGLDGADRHLEGHQRKRMESPASK